MDPQLAARLEEVEAAYGATLEQMADPAVASNQQRYTEVARRHRELRDVVAVYQQWKAADADASAPTAAAAELATGETDREDHDVFLFRVLLDVVVTDVVAAHRPIDAVGEHEDDAASFLVKQGGNADVHRIPERRRTRFLQLGAQNL